MAQSPSHSQFYSISHRPNAVKYFKGYSFNFISLARMEEKKNTEVLWGNIRERDNLEDLGVDGKIMLKEILEEKVCNGRI